MIQNYIRIPNDLSQPINFYIFVYIRVINYTDYLCFLTLSKAEGGGGFYFARAQLSIDTAPVHDSDFKLNI